MAETPLTVPILEALRDLVAWCEDEKTAMVIIGGVAASLLGRPRVTQDLDALLLLPDGRWSAFLESGGRFGFEPRAPDALEFAAQARILLVRHRPTGIPVDLILGALPFEDEAVQRANSIAIQGLRVPLLTAEDLLIMKVIAQRPRDIADFESVLDAHPESDLERVRRWVGAFAQMLERPDLLRELEVLLARAERGNKA